jgi:threonine/homoserine/homoserine lactone efflux protein
MILQAILRGLTLGIALTLSLGPSFFALLQTSTNRGFKPALGLAFGILLSDIFCIVLAYLGVAQFFNNPQNKIYIEFIGGIILVVFGLISIFQKKKIETADILVKETSIQLYITKGFFLNLLNPVVIGIWMACVVSVTSNKEYNLAHIFLFFMTTLLTVFSFDTLKAFYANKISQRLSDKILKNINILLGLILLITGLVFIYRGL